MWLESESLESQEQGTKKSLDPKQCGKKDPISLYRRPVIFSFNKCCMAILWYIHGYSTAQYFWNSEERYNNQSWERQNFIEDEVSIPIPEGLTGVKQQS